MIPLIPLEQLLVVTSEPVAGCYASFVQPTDEPHGWITSSIAKGGRQNEYHDGVFTMHFRLGDSLCSDQWSTRTDAYGTVDGAELAGRIASLFSELTGHKASHVCFVKDVADAAGISHDFEKRLRNSPSMAGITDVNHYEYVASNFSGFSLGFAKAPVHKTNDKVE